MNSFGKIISFILQICLLMPVLVYGKPCSNSSEKCQEVRLPLVSNKLNAPLIAELDVTSLNKQLKTYIRDDIESSFSENIHRMVKNEQNKLKVSMVQDYSSKLNITQTEYDKKISHIVKNLEAKQEELQLKIFDINTNLSESQSIFNTEISYLLSGFQQKQERLKLAMISNYTSKIRQSEDLNKQKFVDLASEQKSQLADLSRELKEEFVKSTINLQTERKELEEWKRNLMATLNETYAPLKYKDCGYMKTKPSGVYTIYPDGFNGIKAYCDMSTDGGGWMVIQRRIDGTTSFDRDWVEYKEGFGDPQKEYWLGNKYLNILTTNGKYELRFDLADTNNKTTYALYKTFTVSDENSQYKLTIGGHSGTASDMMAYNDDQKFTTKDRDHDTSSIINCAKSNGAWWHGDCSNVFLNHDMSKAKLYWGGIRYTKSSIMIRQIM